MHALATNAANNDPRFSPELSFKSMVEKLSFALGNLDPGPLVLRELMRRIGIRSRREPGPKGAWFFSFGDNPVEYRGTTKAADALLPMIEDLLMQHAPPEPSDHKVQMSSLEHAIHARQPRSSSSGTNTPICSQQSTLNGFFLEQESHQQQLQEHLLESQLHQPPNLAAAATSPQLQPQSQPAQSQPAQGQQQPQHQPQSQPHWPQAQPQQPQPQQAPAQPQPPQLQPQSLPAPLQELSQFQVGQLCSWSHPCGAAQAGAPSQQMLDEQRRVYKEMSRVLLQQDMEELASIQNSIVHVSQVAKRKRDVAELAAKEAEEAELRLEVHERKLVTLQRRIQAKQHTLAIEEEEEDAKAAETLVHTFQGSKR